MCNFNCGFIDISCQDIAGWSCDIKATYVVTYFSTFIFGASYIKRVKVKFVGVCANCIKWTSTTRKHSCIDDAAVGSFWISATIEAVFTAVKIAFVCTYSFISDRTVCLLVIYIEISYNVLSHCYTFLYTHGHLRDLLSYGSFTAFRLDRPNHNGFFVWLWHSKSYMLYLTCAMDRCTSGKGINCAIIINKH